MFSYKAQILHMFIPPAALTNFLQNMINIQLRRKLIRFLTGASCHHLVALYSLLLPHRWDFIIMATQWLPIVASQVGFFQDNW